MSIEDRARELLRLHTADELLVLVNVWDVASARAVADQPGCHALATASHAIAASYGYPDGEHIPGELMFDTIGRITAATELPVTADLEAGYGDPGETIRRAIGAGVVGANIEDQMRPLADAVAAVEAVVAAGAAEGVPFVLNARTDAFLHADDDTPHEEVVTEAITRGQAYLDAGATCIFMPGHLDEPTIIELVDALGERRISTLGYPGSLPAEMLSRLGVARLSYGPWPHRVALHALADSAADLLAGGELPEDIREFG